MGTTRDSVFEWFELGFYLCLMVVNILVALVIFVPILGVTLLFWYGVAALVFWFAFGVALPNPFA